MGKSLARSPFDAVRLTALAFLLVLGLWSLLPLAWGWTPAVVRSGSMAPALRPGDLVFYQPGGAARPGRIILADDPNRPGQLLSHRVVDVRPDGSLITRGDANPSPDGSPVAPDAVHGQGRLVVPYIGLLTLVTHRDQLPRVVTFATVVLLALSYRIPQVPTGRWRRAGRATERARRRAGPRRRGRC